MADEATTQESAQDSSVEETTADSQSEIQAQDSNANSTEQAGENQEGQAGDGKADQSASTGDKQQSENQDSKPDSKPLSRRSAAYRIKQLVEENNSLKQQLGKPKGQQQDEWEEESPQEDDKPDIASLVAKEVERRLHPVITESSKAADDAELGELFTGDKAGERTKYESKIREMWKMPQYKDVAAADLYKLLAYDEALATARTQSVEEYKKAQKEAKDSSASGNSNNNRTGKTGKSVADMTPAELEAHNQRVIAGQV